MSAAFTELDWRRTPMGDLTLRRRLEPTLQIDLYEVKLGDEFLMSSLFTVAETELANLALAELSGTDLDVAVGGLGLGYTARAALADDRVRSLHVIEALEDVITWHHKGLLPHASELTTDPRCSLINGDFFALVDQEAPFSPQAPDRYDAILVDIDHTPRHHLHPSHAPFYQPHGLRRLAARIHPGGIFALWSDDPPDDDFLANARQVFTDCDAHIVTFPNPLTDGEGTNTVYLARVPDHGPAVLAPVDGSPAG